MAHFYASIQGNRSEATRMGTKNSGIEGHIRGWDIGAKVKCTFDPETKEDYVTVYLTSGSSGYKSDKLIGSFTVDYLED